MSIIIKLEYLNWFYLYLTNKNDNQIIELCVSIFFFYNVSPPYPCTFYGCLDSRDSSSGAIQCNSMQFNAFQCNNVLYHISVNIS